MNILIAQFRFYYKNYPVASYPILYEAYSAFFPKEALAVAGGYRFCRVNDSIELDASGSLADTYQWTLSDGTGIDHPVVTVEYPNPGLFTEMLTVIRNSEKARDFLQVRVYGENESPDVARGWLYHYPIRGLQAGETVRIKVGLINVTPGFTLDFGDGTCRNITESETTHVYREKGRYIVTCTAKDQDGYPVLLKTEIIVG